jgi:Cu-processing system permease protein
VRATDGTAGATLPATMAVVRLCARQELVLAARSRWLQTFAVVFALLAIAVASAGYILAGGSGVQDFARTATSLVQVVLLLVPLASLVFGVLALTPERGAAEILYSQPVSRTAVLGGRLLGLFEALTAAQAVGFGGAGLIIFAQAGETGVSGFLGVVAGSMTLTAVFLALAALLAGGAGARRRTRALALALVVWFVSVVLFDVAALGAASMLPSASASRLLIVSVLVNPVDAVRTGSLLAVEGTAAFGAASLAFLRFTDGPVGAFGWIALSLLTWTLVPLILGARRLRDMDI